jgi:hypothetical protein
MKRNEMMKNIRFKESEKVVQYVSDNAAFASTHED